MPSSWELTSGTRPVDALGGRERSTHGGSPGLSPASTRLILRRLRGLNAARSAIPRRHRGDGPWCNQHTVQVVCRSPIGAPAETGPLLPPLVPDQPTEPRGPARRHGPWTATP